ncbi:MAG: hypothetical protein ACRDTA_18995 [Pseudonocardiaceae bacterium]
MQEQLEKRVTELDTKRADLQQTLLRISGAIRVLKEILGTDRDSADDGAESPQRSTPPPGQDSMPRSLS